MAKYKKGILGGFYGTVGNVIGSSWRGIEYIKSKPASVNDANTEAQRMQRQKFELIVSFLRKVKPVIDIGFVRGNVRSTSMNRATSYNLKNAITGTYPDQEIDFPSLLISRGDLTPSQDASVESTDPAEVGFSWADNTGMGSAQADDMAVLLVYSPELGIASYLIDDSIIRLDGGYTMTLPSGYEGETVECYLAFVSADGKETSNSDYLGSVVVTETP